MLLLVAQGRADLPLVAVSTGLLTILPLALLTLTARRSAVTPRTLAAGAGFGGALTIAFMIDGPLRLSAAWVANSAPVYRPAAPDRLVDSIGVWVRLPARGSPDLRSARPRSVMTSAAAEHRREVLHLRVARADRASPKRCSIVAMIDVVSCEAWSTRTPRRRPGARVSAGMRVEGPISSCGPGVRALAGGETWSHWPPNSS